MKTKKILAAFLASAITLSAGVIPKKLVANDAANTEFTVSAATTKDPIEIESLPYTFVADGVDNGKRQGNLILTVPQRKATKLTLNFTTECTEEATVAVYGFGTVVKPSYWTDSKISTKTSGAGDFSIEVPIPTAIQGKVNKLGIGIWYPKDNSKFILESITTEGSVALDPANKPTSGSSEASVPESENDKSGKCSFVDNKDGTATFTATYSAQYKTDLEDNKSTEFDYTLKQGTDGSQNFSFKNFGIDDMENVKFQSFRYTLQSEDYDMSKIVYGGGISVKEDSDADTSGDGWYNDKNEEDETEYKVNVHGPYTATGCGSYAELNWDVPKDVQEHVVNSDESNVNFQFWWGEDATQESQDEDGNDLLYAPIKEVHLTNCIATYTRTLTVPYTETVKKTVNASLKTGKTYDLELAESAGMKKRDRLYAVKFTFKNTSEFTKFIVGTGVSLEKKMLPEEHKNWGSWFNGGDIVVLNGGPEAEIMWILPEAAGAATYYDGSLQVGYWYGGKGATALSSTTLSSVEYYIHRTSEKEDIKVLDSEGNEVPEELNLAIGDTYLLDVNVPTAKFECDDEDVVEIDDSGVITALSEGTALVTIKTPEGQTVEITVVVTKEPVVTTPVTTTQPAVTTTTGTTTTRPVTTTPVTTTTPEPVAVPGDVNGNGKINVADLIMLQRYLVNKLALTAPENADLNNDGKVNVFDLVILKRIYLESK